MRQIILMDLENVTNKKKMGFMDHISFSSGTALVSEEFNCIENQIY